MLSGLSNGGWLSDFRVPPQCRSSGRPIPTAPVLCQGIGKAVSGYSADRCAELSVTFGRPHDLEIEVLEATGFLSNSNTHVPCRKISTHILFEGDTLRATLPSSFLRKSGYIFFFDSVPDVGNFGTIKRAFTLATPSPL